MKNVPIKLPKSIEDLRIKHSILFDNPLYQDIGNDHMLLVDFLHDVYGIEKHVLKTLHLSDIHRMYEAAAKAMRYEPKPPPQEITLDGRTFVRINPNKVGLAWHIDAGATNMVRDRVRTMCLFYYPKEGKYYGETDTSGNLIHPIAERIDVFREFCPLNYWLDTSAFFFASCERSMSVYMVQQRIKRMLRKIRSLTNTRGTKSLSL